MPFTSAHTRDARVRPCKELLCSLAHALLRIDMAVTFIELLGRIWGFSVVDFALSNSLGQAISNSLSSIGLILLVTWLLWVVLDTAIQEALKPPVGRRSARQPSTRVRTILPMLHNATKVVLIVICTITTMANLGTNVAPFLAGAGVIGLAIGFGSQQRVHDVITGLFILIEDSISIGDWVVLDSGHTGTVESLTIRSGCAMAKASCTPCRFARSRRLPTSRGSSPMRSSRCSSLTTVMWMRHSR